MPDDLSQLERVSAEFRKALLDRDRQAARAMIDAYGAAWVRIKARVDALNAQIQDARAAGEEVNPSWLFQRQRLQTLQVQVEHEIAGFARYAGQQITSAQSDVVDMAGQHAAGLVQAQFPPQANVTATWARLPRSAVEDLVGNTSDGSPLSDLLNELPGEAGTAVKKELIVGVATGQNPRTVARMIRQELGGNLVRALTISRTEILRSYRTASLRNYQANSDVVEGWIWHSALDRRTCMSCIAMHGTFHRLDEQLDDHVNGRCSALPVTKTWEELGIGGVPETRVQVEKGTDWFARQPESVQREMMGPAKYAAWKAGEFDLKGMVGRGHSAKWGTMRYERSLKEILQGKHGDTKGAKLVAKYLDPVRREAALKAAATRAAAGGGGGSGKGGKPMVAGGGGAPGDGERRRQLRLAQLEKMEDLAFANEMREHQAAVWGQQGLSGHYQRHAADVARWAGREMTEQEYAAFAKDIMARPDRVFTGLTTEEHLEYSFVRSREGRRAIMLTVSRRGLVRTMYPTPIERWLKRHPEQVEVTDRVRRLGLGL